MFAVYALIPTHFGKNKGYYLQEAIVRGNQQ